jgi:hypothetical protein
MSRSPLVLLLVCATAFGLASPVRAATMSYLDNGVVRVGVDLDRGGMIVYLAPSGAQPSANLVDATTLGDGIQPWFQAGPNPYRNPAPPYESNPWNPSVGGDAYGHASYYAAYSSSNDGTTIHTTTYPNQWALDDVGCKCEIEQWLTLDGAAVELRVKLAIYNYDSNEIGAALHDEQLPALHVASTLNRLVAYTDPEPFSGGTVTQLGAGSQRASVTAPESWAALVDASGMGVGVIHPGITRYDYASGFLAPVATANLNPGSSSALTFEDASTIVVGTAAQIRAYAVAHRPDLRPDYQFTPDDSRLWTRWNAGPPSSTSSGFAAVPWEDPQLLGPDEWFDSDAVPTLYVRGAWHTHDTLAQIFWRAPGGPFTEQRSVRFRVVNDGRMHTYAVPLAGQALYTGLVAQLRFDPVCCEETSSLVDLASISWRADPTAIPVAVEHARQLDIRLVRDRRHRFGVIGRLSTEDTYLPCIAGVPIRLLRSVQGTWVQVKRLYTGTGGQFSFALPPKSHSHYRAVADLQQQKGNVCAAIAATA